MAPAPPQPIRVLDGLPPTSAIWSTSRFHLRKARGAGHDVRGISDHGFIRSIYVRDPNGYVIELTAKLAGHDAALDPSSNDARVVLDRWEQRQHR